MPEDTKVIKNRLLVLKDCIIPKLQNINISQGELDFDGIDFLQVLLICLPATM